MPDLVAAVTTVALPSADAGGAFPSIGLSMDQKKPTYVQINDPDTWGGSPVFRGIWLDPEKGVQSTANLTDTQVQALKDAKTPFTPLTEGQYVGMTYTAKEPKPGGTTNETVDVPKTVYGVYNEGRDNGDFQLSLTNNKADVAASLTKDVDLQDSQAYNRVYQQLKDLGYNPAEAQKWMKGELNNQWMQVNIDQMKANQTDQKWNRGFGLIDKICQATLTGVQAWVQIKQANAQMEMVNIQRLRELNQASLASQDIAAKKELNEMLAKNGAEANRLQANVEITKERLNAKNAAKKIQANAVVQLFAVRNTRNMGSPYFGW